MKNSGTVQHKISLLDMCVRRECRVVERADYVFLLPGQAYMGLFCFNVVENYHKQANSGPLSSARETTS